MTIQFEETPCNICSSDNYEIYLVRNDLYTHLPGNFRVVKCKNCGLVYQNPRPTPESWDEIYPDEYDQYIDNQQISKNNIFGFLARYGTYKRAKFLTKYSIGGKVCDIGCSTGDFLTELCKYKQWECYGVEPKKSAAELAKKKGLNVEKGTFSETVFPSLKFDVITLWNVIEHLHDPVYTLEVINKRLNPGGVLIFNTPSLNSWDARIFNQYWNGFELPRHIYIFSEQTIHALLYKTNFTYIDKSCFYGQHAAAMTSLRFFIRSKMHGRHPGFENILFSFPTRILFAPIFFLQDKLNKSSQITIVAMKEQDHG